MLFYDFLYYLIYRFYSSYNEKGAASTSAGIIGGFQALNVFTIVLVFKLPDAKNVEINKLFVITLCIIFQITTYIRYIYRENHSVDVIEKQWRNKSQSSRKKISTFLLLYGLISIVSAFGLAIYIGSFK